MPRPAQRRHRSRIALVALAMVAAVAATTLGVSPVRAQGASGTISPEQVQAALPALEDYIEEVMARTGLPGLSVAVVDDDQVVYLRGFGVRRAGTDLAVDADTVFQMASVSKPVGSTVAAAVVGDGQASWTDTIASRIPGFTLRDPWVGEHVTIADMYSHRSGLPSHAGDLLEDLGFDRDYVLSRLRYEPLAPFRASYAYTNFGITAGGEAIARAAGMSWDDLAEQRLFQPAGMTRTSYRHSDYVAAENRADIHAYVDGTFQPLYQRLPDAEAPAGGLSSTARDMSQWLRLQLGQGTLDGQQIVSWEALQQTRLPHSVTGPPRQNGRVGFYGYGWDVDYPDGPVRLSHSGAFNLGTATHVAMLPSEGLGIAVLTNGAPIGIPESIAFAFFDLVRTGEITVDYLQALGEVFAEINAEDIAPSLPWRTPPADPAPPLAPSAYVGRYANDYFGPMVIAEVAGQLWMAIGPLPVVVPLTHFDANSYTFETFGENANGPSGVVFAVGPSGAADSVTVTAFNKNGLGTFTRVG